MLKIVYLRPRRDWAPTIGDINRAVRAAVRLRRALWALADQDAVYVGFQGDTLSSALTRRSVPVRAIRSRILSECGRPDRQWAQFTDQWRVRSCIYRRSRSLPSALAALWLAPQSRAGVYGGTPARWVVNPGRLGLSCAC